MSEWDIHAGAAVAEWQTQVRAGGLELLIDGRIEFDGAMEYRLVLTAREAVAVDDIALRIPFRREAGRYMTGLGWADGSAPGEFAWSWDVEKNQDAFWLGQAHVGAQITLKDDAYSRPLNTNFYRLKPLVLPDGWHNGGQGYVRMGPAAGEVFPVTCGGGPRTLAAGEELVFGFRVLLTPFKPIDPAEHLGTRFYHAPAAPADVVAEGANTINIHHANALNPYINYPFFANDALREYVREAHELGCRVKLYYTVRELTTRAPELFPLMSLGDEIIVDGEGGGHAWLREHLQEHYIAAWYAAAVRDTSVINGVLSRWHNHYVEGLDWLARTLEIDGVYIDDLGFGREVMQRVRRVLARHRPRPIIDLHSANQFNERDGFASSTNLYMEHFPYLDRLWFGEYFDYDKPPEYWLVEVSGIPFGLMSEMLQDGGNPWRGMVFGMTGRLPRVTANRALWAFWDAVDLPGAEMIGWWSDRCPVRVDDDRARCTVYARDGGAVLALAGWGPDALAVTLAIDWDHFGIDPARAVLRAGAIEEFQDARTFDPVEAIPIEPGKGWLLILEERL